ncbi:Crp/Fnr family transcriptional regulator [Puia sp. P3]|uniref:Crp/Fnr family transcriptional regulator n=1 Tax=Puia sp. P3 TaxID=3423952 RepID=UPI003D665347
MATPILPFNGGPIGSVVDLINYLDSLSSSGFSEELRSHLFSAIRVESVKKLGYLLEEGKLSRHIYFIRRGILRCYYRQEDDTEVTTWILREPNVVVAVNSFYRQEPSFEIIQALVDTEVYYISHDELERIYERFPQFERVGRLLTIEYLIFWNMQLLICGCEASVNDLSTGIKTIRICWCMYSRNSWLLI